MTKTYKFSITPVTYLHIGSGEVIEPINYVIKDRKLYYINQNGFLKHLVNEYKDRVFDVLDSHKLNEIAKFWHNKFDPKIKNTWLYYYDVPQSVQTEYEANLDKTDNLNVFYQFIRSSLSGNPIIPGSSLKGMIRTVILSKLASNSRNQYENSPKTVEGTLLKVINHKGGYDIPDDPFKYLKVSDTHVLIENMTIGKLTNIKGSQPVSQSIQLKPPPSLKEFQRMREQGNLSTATQQISFNLEVIKSAQTPIASGVVNIDDRFYQKVPAVQNIQNSIEALPKLLNDYHLKLYEADKNFFNQSQLKDKYQEIGNMFQTLDKSECIVRFGKGIGKHSLVLETKRSLPTTRNLIDGYSVGWCKLKFTV